MYRVIHVISLRGDVTRGAERWAAMVSAVRRGEFTRDAADRNIRASRENDAVTTLLYVCMSNRVDSFVYIHVWCIVYISPEITSITIYFLRIHIAHSAYCRVGSLIIKPLGLVAPLIRGYLRTPQPCSGD